MSQPVASSHKERREEIFPLVRQCIKEAIGHQRCEPEIQLSDTLAQLDESIICLDVVFKINRQFGLQIPNQDIVPAMTVSEICDCVMMAQDAQAHASS